MDFIKYAKLIKFTHGEELERMSEFLHAVEHLEDSTENDYYLMEVESNIPPSYSRVEKAMEGLNVDVILAALEKESTNDEERMQKEDLISELREMLL